jgi:hypothetical protein
MIYFVTEQFIKDNTAITQNVDAKDLAPFIPMAVKTYVQPILGFNFTNDLLVKFNNGTTSAEEDELIEFIQYMTALWAAYDAIPNISFRVSNKGIQSQSGDYSASEGIAAVEYIRTNVQKFAYIYENNMRKFLALNKTSFPLYLDELNKEIQAPDKDNSPQSSITFI